MLYFAYGSNMSLKRLRARVPSAEPLGTAQLRGHRLCFHMPSGDGSAKCDALDTGKHYDLVWGVIFEIDMDHKPALDRAESLGELYHEKTVRLHTDDGDTHEAFTYCALVTGEGRHPYSWYHHHVVSGAREFALPAGYVAEIAAVAHIQDPEAARDAREWLIHDIVMSYES
ncbi:MAG: gamma-glutamylcyclotransferase family protein [Pseudomonadota bacterium]